MCSKSFLNKCFYLIIIASFSLCIPGFSQEVQVNSTDSSLIIHAGAGYGDSIYGVFKTDDVAETTGLEYGSATGIELGALYSYKMIAAGFNFDIVDYNNTKTTAGAKKKSYGDGAFWTYDLTIGPKLCTEPGDMGYTYLYGGFKYWKAVRDVDFVDENGSIQDGYKDEVSGKGWCLGIRDYSTFPVGTFSIVLQTGFMYYYAPLDSGKSDGQKIHFKKEDTFSYVFEIGAGIAFEDTGLSVIAGFKTDENATTYKYTGGTGETWLLGSGYSMFFLTITKEFTI